MPSRYAAQSIRPTHIAEKKKKNDLTKSSSCVGGGMCHKCEEQRKQDSFSTSTCASELVSWPSNMQSRRSRDPLGAISARSCESSVQGGTCNRTIVQSQ